MLEVRIFKFGLGGPNHRCHWQITLLPSLIMPPFPDLSSSHLLRLMLARYSSSHRTLCFQSHFFIRCIASHRNCIPTGYYEKKKVSPFMSQLLRNIFIYINDNIHTYSCILDIVRVRYPSGMLVLHIDESSVHHSRLLYR